MRFEMQKANLLAENINHFITFVDRIQNNPSFSLNIDKMYQIELFIEEFKFQVIADELVRINRFDWDEKYTSLLVTRFRKGFKVIDEYVNRNYNDLFLLTARIHTLNNLSLSFSSSPHA
ncbi:hypothetical protein [Mesobacillus harenae]|uniref:hypothetical protein n=1 Tax=Mesobacillus harenae TaxID=2213203 RepID=UPI001580E1F8|nr:hypothetical protein [Mesobacillus harenae]